MNRGELIKILAYILLGILISVFFMDIFPQLWFGISLIILFAIMLGIEWLDLMRERE